MKIFQYLCRIGLHAWGHEVEAKRYRHNKRFDKTKNALTAAKPIAQKCRRCGMRRVWSFRRGCWRPADPERELGYEGANIAQPYVDLGQVDSVAEMRTELHADTGSAQSDALKSAS